MTTAAQTTHIHHGRNIKRFREMFGLKQEALAIELGPDWSQKKVSRLEENEMVDEDVLEQVAKVLNIPKEAIKNFTEEAAVNYFNTFNDHSGSNSAWHYSTIHINNPLIEYSKLVEENKRLYDELIRSEREKNALLEKLLNQK